MIVDGVGDVVGFALCAGVQTADDALQFRELANHLGGEIAFGQFGGAVSVGDVRLWNAEVEPLLHEPARDGADALDFVGVAAEAGFVSDLGELRKIVGEPTFLIGGPEELSVGEARTQDAFVAGSRPSPSDPSPD